MKLSNIKHLVQLMESRGINDDYDLKFVVNISENPQFIELEDFELDRTDNDNQRFDIGHSDKIVNIFLSCY